MTPDWLHCKAARARCWTKDILMDSDSKYGVPHAVTHRSNVKIFGYFNMPFYLVFTFLLTPPRCR